MNRILRMFPVSTFQPFNVLTLELNPDPECSMFSMGNGEREKEKREMKTWTWVWVLILALGDLATRVGAQTIAAETNSSFASAFQSGIGSQIATTTNFPFANPPIRNATNPVIQQSGNPISGAPSTTATNFSFGSAFQNKIGSQTATTTNFAFANLVRRPVNPAIQPSSPPISGAPSMIATNFSFDRAFENGIGSQIEPATNPSSTASAQSGGGGQSVPASFLFASSAQSFIGQGQGLFASTTNGYNVQLFQIAPNILQFTVSPVGSINTNWLVEFTTTNDFFTAGLYTNAVNAGGSPARLVFGGTGRGDNTSDGIFNVLEATYSGDQIVSFAADFIQFDNGNTNGWNEGSIRYNSTIPDSVNLFMAPVTISFQKGNAVLTWSTNLAGFQLEFATNLPANTWFTNNAVPAIVDGQFSVTDTNGVAAGMHVYRLMKPMETSSTEPRP
jgi:hypothetical protein